MHVFKLDSPQTRSIKERTLVGVVLLVRDGSPMPMQLYVEMLPPASQNPKVRVSLARRLLQVALGRPI